jgi:Tol biopolymer transport system component
VFAPDGKTLFVLGSLSGSSQFHVLDFDGGKLTKRWEPHPPVIAPVFSPDGSALAASVPWHNSWWDLTAAAPKERPATRGRYLAGVGLNRLFLEEDDSLFEWDGKQRRHVTAIHSNNIYAITPDGCTLVHGIPGAMQLFELSGGKKQLLAGFKVPTNVFGLRPDGKALFAGARDTPKPSFHLFQRTNKGWQETWKGAPTYAAALAARADRFAVATDTQDVVLDISSTPPREVAAIPRPSGFPARQLSFSPDGKLIAATRLNGGVNVYEVESRTQIYKCTIRAYEPKGVAFAPDGRHLAVSSDYGVTLILRLKGPAGKS